MNRQPTNLKQQFGSIYVVQDDGTRETDPKEKVWCMQICGKHGFIYPHGWDGTLAVCVTSNRVAKRIESELNLRRHVKGDFETVLLFEPAMLPRVATLIKAKRRKVISPELRAKLVDRIAKARKSVGKSVRRPELH